MPEPLDRGLKPLERLVGRHKQGLSLVGQQQPAIAAAKERYVQAILEPPDPVADRRLGHVQLVSGLGEALVPGRGLEGANRIERRKAVVHARFGLILLMCAMKSYVRGKDKIACECAIYFGSFSDFERAGKEWIMTGLATRMNDSHAIGATANGASPAAPALSTLAALAIMV